MSNVSDEELRALRVHDEVENSQWLRLRKRILIRGILVVVMIVIRAVLMKAYPQDYMNTIFNAAGLASDEVASLISARLILGAVLSAVYLYALMTNRFLRTVSIVALIVPVAIIWADLQIFLLSSFPAFTVVAAIGFTLRLIALYLLVRNYIDIRR